MNKVVLVGRLTAKPELRYIECLKQKINILMCV